MVADHYVPRCRSENLISSPTATCALTQGLSSTQLDCHDFHTQRPMRPRDGLAAASLQGPGCQPAAGRAESDQSLPKCLQTTGPNLLQYSQQSSELSAVEPHIQKAWGDVWWWKSLIIQTEPTGKINNHNFVTWTFIVLLKKRNFITIATQYNCHLCTSSYFKNNLSIAYLLL